MNSSTSHGDDDAFFVEFRDVWFAYNEELLRANHFAVEAIDHAKRRVTLATRCLVGDTVVLKGEAVVLAPSRKFD